MAQPSTIYKPSKLNYMWNYLSSTLDNFKAKLLGYRSYKALLTQTGSNDPTAIVLENTLNATVVWYRQAQGIYYAESFGTWKTNKTAILVSPLLGATGAVITKTYTTTEDQIFFETIKTTLAPMDDSLNNTFVEIRVYN